MLKNLQKKYTFLIAGAGLCAFLAGAMFSAPQIGKSIGQLFKQGNNEPEQVTETSKAKSVVLPLVLQSKQERAAKLAALAKDSQPQDEKRARYLLGSDLIDQKQGKNALSLLQGLDQEYSLLAPYVLLKQAQAQDILGEEGKASDLRQKVIKTYPKEPAIAKSLYLIGTPEYQDKAIAEFPSHPLTWEIIRKRLQENSNQPQLQLILAKHAYDQPGIVPVLDQLVNSPTLKPAEWEIIGTAYWENNEFGKASEAYSKAPKTARNLYRVARGFQIGGKQSEASAIYKQLVSEFPEATETGTGLLRLAEMVKIRKDALPYLNQVINKFPNKAPQALLEKVKILQTQDKKLANEAQQLLLTKYGNSLEAAEYRWKIALDKAKAKDYRGAWQWAQPIATNVPNSILAPRAGFWVGKWANKLGKKEEAKKAYEYVLSQYPYSYYAWRSAAVLGLNVGNFNSVRQMNPQVVPLQRPLPPAGSNTFKELYLLGQDRDAWLQWQTEFQNKMQPTVAEQFTEGLMRLVKGENLNGIDKISKLEDRETPEEQAQYNALSKQLIYWQARYPFPYLEEIKKWSGERQLNPLLVTALIRQESRFESKVKSIAGATGLMQVMPDTAKWIAPQIKLDPKKINLENPNDNIKLGTWYLDHTHEQYGNNSLLAIASYNAGPGNVSKWLQTLPKDDPDEFVEAIPFDETKNYVRQVFGNYWNYLRLYNPEISQLVSQYSAAHPQLPAQ
ncbi:transglycosylase SLT domain-containing protein [Iningainema tapete]|uniref:Transglycosylase SLT domain-containing protein n=1 Tax=Iningainema tapete BLCC-T55 TaxID=2748662 RepID=A0A8J6XJG5_9CYAN|nr:transglycosylase SLT domain-containing protein [Iningainema tapete]MBD2773606.1 transglycosylase SLT domain-containing protein [Iningainema tapete BLCC-T55]